MENAEELKAKAEKINEIKDNIKGTLKNYHSNIAMKNRIEAEKQQLIKKEILDLKKEQNDQIFKKNKQISKIVREQIKSAQDKKRTDEVLFFR